MKKRVLIVTPRFPFFEKGACEQDRVAGIKMFLEKDFEVVVICKALENEMPLAAKFEKSLGIKIIPITYKFSKSIKRFFNPLYWDGAAFEYFDREIQKNVKQELEEFKPNFVYFDYTFLWPLYNLVRNRKIPIITRSINFEPLHFLEEDGYSIKSLLMFPLKLLSEIISLHRSDIFFSISPKEQIIYKWLGKKVINLPLRSLLKFLDWEYTLAEDESTLNVFFAGSTYNVKHNKKALKLILKKIAPKAERICPGRFIFHIIGNKFPGSFKKYLECRNIKYHGFVPKEELDNFFKNMDIALIPSLAGAGMQQKVFEPLARGIPTITSKRGLAGYQFKDGEHVLLAKNNDYLSELVKMQDSALRNNLSKKSKEFSKKIFSKEVFNKLANALFL